MVILMRVPEFVDDEHTAEVYDDLIDYIADMIDRGARVDAIGQVLVKMAYRLWKRSRENSKRTN